MADWISQCKSFQQSDPTVVFQRFLYSQKSQNPTLKPDVECEGFRDVKEEGCRVRGRGAKVEAVGVKDVSGDGKEKKADENAKVEATTEEKEDKKIRESEEETIEDDEESKHMTKEDGMSVQETPVKQIDVYKESKSTDNKSNSKEPKKPFQRVNVEEVVFADDRLKDTSYWAKKIKFDLICTSSMLPSKFYATFKVN
ncbi:unnamed protein product [Eruca vesicaria subsp. sativa]|uniref:Uncharacterized protein n=1 Tax=Eruca vesicaria subsp. sativa TaxID=29727 RepID=A0ABC8JNB7_ERUVS|nr:unnamed protein product [Eruca vesicaria subsp. sativa]